MTGRYTYQPGSTPLVVSATGGVLTSDAALAARLWPLIVRGAPLSALLEEALRDGLAQLPDLMLFEVDASALRVVVRGKLTVRVQLSDGASAEFDGEAVRTWNEQVFPQPVQVNAGEQASAGLPLQAGMVLAAGFRWVADGTIDDAPPSEHRDDKTPIAAPALSVAKPSSPTRVPAPVVGATVGPDELVPAGSGLPDTRIEPIDDSFEHLFESTVMRSVEDAAVRAPEEEQPLISAVPAIAGSTAAGAYLLPGNPPKAAEPPVTADRPGDHDGSTIMAGQLAAVLASTGDPVAVPPALPSRPPVLLISTGQRVEVDRSVVIGRRPQVDRVSGSEIPHLVPVPSPQQDISRSHVAVRPSGTGCVAVDLGSTNGSVIRRATGATVMLAHGAILDLQPGDILDLGDGVSAVLQAPS